MLLPCHGTVGKGSRQRRPSQARLFRWVCGKTTLLSCFRRGVKGYREWDRKHIFPRGAELSFILIRLQMIGTWEYGSALMADNGFNKSFDKQLSDRQIGYHSKAFLGFGTTYLTLPDDAPFYVGVFCPRYKDGVVWV